MKKCFVYFLTFIICLPSTIWGQNINIQLSKISIPEFKGVQSYAWAKYENKILLVGGRLDGLHQKQPFLSFARQFNNTNLIVLDLQTNQIWSRSLIELNQSIWEQLQSSNMEFWQDGNEFVLVGGYGYSDLKKDFITHPAICIIEVRELINSVINGESIAPFIHQITDQRMAITGGNLGKIESTYLLIGGHRFDGRYNPHSPDHGPGYKQQYSNELRKFELSKNGSSIEIRNFTAEFDTALYHRRDFTLLPQYNTEGEKVFTLFSGVFRPEIDLPYYTLVDINKEKGKLLPNFYQKYSHYHTAAVAIYDSIKQDQYDIFFGGIAQIYKDKKGKNISDENVPFTNTISIIKRSKESTTEFTLNQTMPGYFGASSHFIPASEELIDSHGLFKYNKLKDKSVLIGYIIGGIESNEPNIFWDGDESSSKASNLIWKVVISIN